jgi:lauroyl/myristoyl acyltransferase
MPNFLRGIDPPRDRVSRKGHTVTGVPSMSNPTLFSILRALPHGRRPDYRRLASLSAGYLLTLAIPSRFDQRVVGRLVQSPLVVKDAWVRRIEELMRSMLGADLPDADFRLLAREYCEITREIQWIRFRAIHTFDVPIETTVEGLERVHAALEAGKGAILWGMSFCDLVPKGIALYRAGVPLVALATAFHGVPTNSRLGLEVVGPFYSAQENRFLSERVMIPADRSRGFMPVLKQRLSENSVLYIRGDLESVRTNYPARVFGRETNFAPGAPGLSWKMGSALLPLHVVRDGPFRYRVVIHPPVEVDRDLDGDSYIRQAVDGFAALLERCALESPTNWDIWAILA